MNKYSHYKRYIQRGKGTIKPTPFFLIFLIFFVFLFWHNHSSFYIYIYIYKSWSVLFTVVMLLLSHISNYVTIFFFLVLDLYWLSVAFFFLRIVYGTTPKLIHYTHHNYNYLLFIFKVPFIYCFYVPIELHQWPQHFIYIYIYIFLFLVSHLYWLSISK